MGRAVGSEPLPGDLCDPLGSCRTATPATTVVFAGLSSVGRSCRLFWAASSPRTRHRTDARAQGGGWLRRPVWAGKLFTLPFVHMELQWVAGDPILTTISTGTLECRSARRNSFSGRNGPLASGHCLPQFAQKYWGKFYSLLIALEANSCLCI
jgi:hypothetical protein